MLINLETKETFKSRKEAKESLGHSKYNRLAKEGKILYVNDSTLASCGEIYTNTCGH